MAHLSKPKPVLFMEEVCRSDYIHLTLTDVFDNRKNLWLPFIKDNVWCVPCDVLYKEYQAWSKNNGYDKVLCKNYFSRDIDKITTSMMDRVNGKLTRCKSYKAVVITLSEE